MKNILHLFICHKLQHLIFIQSCILIQNILTNLMEDSNQDIDCNNYIFISISQVENYIATLDAKQGRDLNQMIHNHPQIDVYNQEKHKYFKGKGQIMKELQYIVQMHNQRNLSEKIESINNIINETSLSYDIQKTKKIEYCYALNINEHNYKLFVQRVLSLKALPSPKIEFCLDKNMVVISNRCIQTRQIFIVYSEDHELVQLQSIIDRQWWLITILEIVKNMQNKRDKIMMVEVNSQRTIYFFQRTTPSDWPRSIKIISQKISSNSFMIVTKFKYFTEMRQHLNLFHSIVRVAIHQDEFQLAEFDKIEQINIRDGESITQASNLALQILNKQTKDYSFEEFVLDPITCFNIVQLIERNTKNILFVRPKSTNTKQYVYFVFQNKFMQILRQQDKIYFQERKLIEAIKDSTYRRGIEEMRRIAAVNQLQFFYICEEAIAVQHVKIASLKKLKKTDANRLLYYKFKTNQHKYKIECQNQEDIAYVMKNYEYVFNMRFQTKQIGQKIGKLVQSQGLIKKYREDQLCCFQGKKTFCTRFINSF